MRIYLVKPHDTIWSIATKYGVSLQSIVEANILKNLDQLVVGQILFVPLWEIDYKMIPNHPMWSIDKNYDLNSRINNGVQPGAPTKLSVQRNTLNSVLLFWKAPSDNTQISGYYILRNNIPIVSTTNLVFEDTNIKIGITYYYKVTAYTSGKIYSGYSNIARIYITPSIGIEYWSKANQYSGYLKGIDVSLYIPELDWIRIKNDEVKFAYVRSGGSVLNHEYTPDIMAQRHTIGIKSVGIPVGFYYTPHWSYLDYDLNKANTEAEKYANHILNLTSEAGVSVYGDLIPVIDIEIPLSPMDIGLTGKQIINWAKVFCDHFKSYTGRTVMIYTSRSFCDTWDIKPQTNILKNLPLWCAEYYEFNNYLYITDTPKSFGGWKGWNIWQFSQTAIIGGYLNMDQNWCRSLDLIMPPSEPTNLTGYNSSLGEVTLTWNKNTETDLKGYNVFKDGILISTNTNNFITVTGLKTGETYKFQIQALDIFNDISNLVSVGVYIS